MYSTAKWPPPSDPTAKKKGGEQFLDDAKSRRGAKHKALERARGSQLRESALTAPAATERPEVDVEVGRPAPSPCASSTSSLSRFLSCPAATATKHVHQTTSAVVLRCLLARKQSAPHATRRTCLYLRALLSFPAEIHEHGSPSPPALQARQSPRPECGYGFSAAIFTETATIYLRSFSCFRCFLHTSALASRFSPLASRFSLLASCPRSKPSDTFGYCPSTRCNKITRRNIGFWAFGEGDARARGAMLWRPVGPRA